MSYTEIYKFNKAGDACFVGEIKNSFRGAMAVWRHLEEKYLPSLPGFGLYQPNTYHSRLHSHNEKVMDEFWALVDSEKLTDSEKLVLATTYDRVVVLRKDFQLVIDAFNNFEAPSSLKEQAAFIEKIIFDEDAIAIAWNQRDDNGHWSIQPEPDWELEDEDDAEQIPYNLFRDKLHNVIYDDGSLNKE